MRRWRCNGCKMLSTVEQLLRAVSPFDPEDEVIGCPHCKQNGEGFTEICDEPGCEQEAGCGWKPEGAPYRRTCYKHMGKHHTETVKPNCPPPSWMFPK